MALLPGEIVSPETFSPSLFCFYRAAIWGNPGLKILL